MFDYRLFEYRYGSAGGIVQKCEIVEEFSCGILPIEDSFFACPVVRGIVYETVYRGHGSEYGFCQMPAVVFHQQETLQHIEIVPGIPVVDNHARCEIECHPEEVVGVHVRLEHPCLHFMADSFCNNRVCLV